MTIAFSPEQSDELVCDLYKLERQVSCRPYIVELKGAKTKEICVTTFTWFEAVLNYEGKVVWF